MLYTGGMTKARRSAPLDLLFRALADGTRLRLLNLIGEREICVCYFVEILRASQPKISRHLAYLRKAGIATARREGKWMHYRLTIPGDEVAARILRETLKHLRKKPEMRRDLARLNSACRAAKVFVDSWGPPPARMRARRD